MNIEQILAEAKAKAIQNPENGLKSRNSDDLVVVRSMSDLEKFLDVLPSDLAQPLVHLGRTNGEENGGKSEGGNTVVFSLEWLGEHQYKEWILFNFYGNGFIKISMSNSFHPEEIEVTELPKVDILKKILSATNTPVEGGN